MKKLKAYLVDEGIYWRDKSLKEASINYMNFCLAESWYYNFPDECYPKELTEEHLKNKYLDISFGNKSLLEVFLEKETVGLFHCDIL